ncbi:MAG: hypothetical protein RUMPE_00674 [Eubacteriales bacterium SKADARSKE-1]|nr:hypothetical protein [Eubacteriales bacterium SKADARSKE-1]
MSISVAMAVFNGEKYIKEQIHSILPQLSPEDELIVSCDKSSDNTLEIIKNIAFVDGRVNLIEGPGQGAVKNFENAILNCNNEYIFLSDQDDSWLPNKVNCVLKEFQKTNADLILHDAIIVDENLQELHGSFFKKRNSKPGILNNIIKNSYIGCCMAFKKDLRKKFLPFPRSIPMHDQWIGLIAEKYGKVSFLSKKLIKYRRHNNTATAITHSNVKNMIIWRITLIKEFLFYKKSNTNN